MEAGDPLHQKPDDSRDLPDKVLAVVEDEQHALVLQRRGERLERRPVGRIARLERLERRQRDELRQVDGRERHNARAVREGAPNAPSRLAGEPCLARAAGTGDREQTAAGHRSRRSSASSRSRPTNVVCVSQFDVFASGGPLPMPAWARRRGSATSTAAEKR